jgi:hypothetical protein
MTVSLQTEAPDVLRLRDPLSEVTRKERRALLGVSVLGMALVHTGLVPSEITALGIKLTAPAQSSLLQLMAAICGYFLIAFSVYATSDYASWQRALHDSIYERIYQSRLTNDDDVDHILHSYTEDKIAENYPQLVLFVSLTAKVTKSRAFVEFLLPIAVGLYAIVALLAKSAA